MNRITGLIGLILVGIAALVIIGLLYYGIWSIPEVGVWGKIFLTSLLTAFIGSIFGASSTGI